MRMHKEPRCQNCKYSQGGRGNDYLCGLLRTKDDRPALLVTPTTEFEKYENCAYRRWNEMLSLNQMSTEDLVSLARRARSGEITPTDYPWAHEAA